MNRSYLAGLALAFAAMQPGMAAPITYNINFTTTSGIAPTSGSFTYDAATTTFTAFTVLWNSATINFTSAANINSPSPQACNPGSNTPAGNFQLMAGTDTCISPRSWFIIPNAGFSEFTEDFPGGGTGTLGVGKVITGPFSAGTFTISQASTSTPEPNTIMSMATGLLAIGLLTHNRRSRPARTTIEADPPDRESR